MEIWQWHPVFVHFTVALLFTSSILFIVRALSDGKAWVHNCLNAARWLFWIGIIMTLFTATAGLLAYFTVPNIDGITRSAINAHAVSAVLTAGTYLIMAFFLWKRQKINLPPGNGWTAVLLLAIALLTYTAYLGGDLVFKRGVGVTSESVLMKG